MAALWCGSMADLLLRPSVGTPLQYKRWLRPKDPGPPLNPGPHGRLKGWDGSRPKARKIPELLEMESEDSEEDSDGPERQKRPRLSLVPPIPRVAVFPGALLTGKASFYGKSGVLVDIGSFTVGLVPRRELSPYFVENMEEIWKKKLDLRVTVTSVKEHKNRIYLTMMPKSERPYYRWDPPETTIYDLATTSVGSEFNRGRTYEPGAEVLGMVKSTTMAGSVVALRDGGVGFVPTAERGTVIGGQTVVGPPPLIPGKKVKVTVVGVVAGSLTLAIDPEMVRKAVEFQIDHGYEWDICAHGVLEPHPNPFEYAFYRHREVARFLNERRRKDPWV